MAVQDPTGGNQQNGTSASDAAAGLRGGQQQQQQQGGRRDFGLASLNSRLSRPMSRSAASEGVMKLHNSFKTILEEEVAPKEVGFRLIVLDGANAMLALSSILVCFSQTFQGREHVAVHTLLIESSGRLVNRTINVGGQNVEIQTVPGDVADDNMWAKVQQAVTEGYGRTVEVHDAGATVVPSELNVEDSFHVRQCLYGAVQATYSTMVNHGIIEEEPFSAKWVTQQDVLSARLDFYPEQPQTAAGLPVRSDVLVTLQGVIAGQGQSQAERALDITRVDGFIDLVYSPPQGQMGFQPYGMAQMPQQITQHYVPRFVMTQVSSEISAVTMELQLLAMSTSTLLVNGSGGIAPWMNSFKPRYNAGALDLRDVGAVGYEVNLTGDVNAKPDRIDTKADSFTQQSLYQLIYTALHPKLMYSMDIEEVSDLSWINLAFIAAARGDQDAIRLIIQSADRLTNNNFSRIFNGSEAIAQDDNNRVHLGYYIDQAGARRDLRDIDYLAMLNWVGSKDMTAVKQWSETFDRRDIPMEIRLERRQKILEHLLGTSLHVKGFARRITFNPNFILALNQACDAAGLKIRPGNIVQDFNGVGQYGDANALNFAIGGVQSGLFTFSQPGFGQTRGFAMPAFGMGNFNR